MVDGTISEFVTESYFQLVNQSFFLETVVKSRFQFCWCQSFNVRHLVSDTCDCQEQRVWDR